VRHSVTDPGFVVLLVAHVLTAVVGYGALGATGAYARTLRNMADPYRPSAVGRFFSPGPNLAARAIFLVPVFGIALVVAEGGSTSSAAFVWIGGALWLASLALCAYLIWPAEAAIQRLLPLGRAEHAALLAAARRLEQGAALTSLLFLAALVVMVAQP
jgi:hypothetical protein